MRQGQIVSGEGVHLFAAALISDSGSVGDSWENGVISQMDCHYQSD
jgi:hypothetical protein